MIKKRRERKRDRSFSISNLTSPFLKRFGTQWKRSELILLSILVYVNVLFYFIADSLQAGSLLNVAELFAFLTCVIEATPLEPYTCVAMVKVISLSFILQLQPLLRWWTLGFRVKQKT